MRTSFFVTLASLSFAAAAPNPLALAEAQPQTAAASCTDKCSGYTTWMNSCAGYEPSGSGWPSACTEYCTSSSKRKAYNECTSCMSQSGSGGDNGSLERLCTQLQQLGKIPSTTSSSKSKATASGKDKNAAGLGVSEVGAGVVALVALVGALVV